MIFQGILDIFFTLIGFIINLIPTFDSSLPNYIGQTLDLLAVPLSIFPLDLWLAIIGNLLFWATIQFSWAGIEWLYKKVPGVS